MFVCQCRVVTDRRIHEAIESGAHTIEAIGFACGAGAECGGCQPVLRDLLAEHGIEVDLPRRGPSMVPAGGGPR